MGAARGRPAPAAIHSPRGSRRRVPRDVGLGSHRPTGHVGDADPARRRQLLVDCGEGTQRQLLKSDVGLIDLEDIFLTHFHADHFLGLPGMLKTFALRGRDVPLTLHGPVGLRDLLAVAAAGIRQPHLPDRDGRARPGRRARPRRLRDPRLRRRSRRGRAVGYLLAEADRPGRFDVDVADALGVPPGASAGCCSVARPSSSKRRDRSRPSRCSGLPRPSRSLALTGDTGPAASVVEAAAGVDLLVHEATFCADERQRARETKHSTAAEAALAAQGSGRRTACADPHLEPLPRQRRRRTRRAQLFANTVVPRDFDLIEMPLRGAWRAGARAARRPARPRPGGDSARRGARRVNERGTPDFGARARVYDTLRPTDATWWEAFAAMVELGDLRGRRVLDVGCGTGRLVAALVNDAHAKAWGIDASGEMVAVARETVPASCQAFVRARPSSCRSATDGSIGSRCRSCSTSSTARGRSPRRGGSCPQTVASRSAPSIPTTSRPTGCTRSSRRSRRSTSSGSRRPTSMETELAAAGFPTGRDAQADGRERAQP